MDNVVVSVCMITYNHEKYIAEAIHGVLKQQTNFDVEFIIANDASKDETDGVIAENIKDSSKFVIKYFNHENNLGMIPNFVFALNQCKGKYVAFCEGDDYWKDPFKLQKQVNFLENNPDYSVAFHDALVVDGEGEILKKSKLKEAGKKDLTSSQLKNGAVVPSASLVYRNIFHSFPPEVSKILNADTFLLSFLGQHGMGKYLDNIEPSAYRLHGSGVWSAISEFEKVKKKLYFLKQMSLYYRNLNDKETAESFELKRKKLSERYLQRASKQNSINYFREASSNYFSTHNLFKLENVSYFSKRFLKFSHSLFFFK